MPASDKEFRALVEAQVALGDSGAEAVAVLLGVSGAFASVVQSAEAAEQAAEQARSPALDSAFSALQRAVKAEQDLLSARLDVARESQSALSDIFDLLRDNVRDLYGEVDSTAAMQAAQEPCLHRRRPAHGAQQRRHARPRRAGHSNYSGARRPRQRRLRQPVRPRF